MSTISVLLFKNSRNSGLNKSWQVSKVISAPFSVLNSLESEVYTLSVEAYLWFAKLLWNLMFAV